MKKIIASLAVFLVAAVVVVGAVGMTRPDVLAVRPVTAEAPCPVVGCASGACHGFDDVPEPDGVTEMTCPRRGASRWSATPGRRSRAATIRRATPA